MTTENPLLRNSDAILIPEGELFDDHATHKVTTSIETLNQFGEMLHEYGLHVVYADCRNKPWRATIRRATTRVYQVWTTAEIADL